MIFCMFLWRLSPYSSAIKSVLANRGISIEEISNLMNLPNDLYMTELTRFNTCPVDNFKAVIPSGEETSLEPFSFKLQSGNGVILQAGSGEGKSITLMGIMHLLENSGSIHIVENGVAKDVHSFSGNDELSRKILLVTEEGLNGTERISDIFKHAFETSHRDLFLSQIDKKTSAMLLEVAWRMGDGLLEAEINKLQNGEKAVFPKKMLTKLTELRDIRNS